ncbi:cytochrome b [Schizosaccharomyces pombe]
MLFLISETFLFASIFWAFFHSSLSPTFELGAVWPPVGIADKTIDPLEVPLLNTVILLTSGASLTYAHYSLIARNRENALKGLYMTIALSFLFLGGQAYEYWNAPFTISDSVYGASFYFATGLHGYCLPANQMSFWGATVITNLLSAVPFIGDDLVHLLWGGFSVSNPTLNRFFSLHYLMPFVIAALSVMHLIALHTNGSSNPLGVTANMDRIPMSPYYLIKDLITIFIFLIGINYMAFYNPYGFMEPDCALPADPLKTPMSIVPEWYLLPFYAILRAIPNFQLGVIAMLLSILVLLLLPLLDFSAIRGNSFNPFGKFFFWAFVADFVILAWIGGSHPENVFITIGAIATIFYFSYFFILIPVYTILEQFELNNYFGLYLFNYHFDFSNFGFYLGLSALIAISLAIINLTPYGSGAKIVPQKFGLIPYGYATTAQLIFTLGLSISILIGATILGLQQHKAKFFGLFLPSGTPTPLIPLLVLIEFVSYIARGLSLGIRLGANIIAGHLTMSILGGLIFTFMGLNFITFVIGFLPITVLVAISLLEFGIAFIQAYVFAILTCGFINDSLNLH